MIVYFLRRHLYGKKVLRWGLFLDAFATLSMLLVFFLIDRYQHALVGDRLQAAVGNLHTSYFGYVTLGLAISQFSQIGLGGLISQFSEERGAGTLEVIFSSPLSLLKWAAGSGLVNFMRGLFELLLILLVATLVLRLRLPAFNAPLLIGTILLSAIPLWCVSALSLAFAMALRRGDPLGIFLSVAFELCGGVFVPLATLPRAVRVFSECLPITPSLRAIHAIVYAGASFPAVSRDLAQIILLTAILLPTAAISLRVADRISRKNGYYVFHS